MTGRSLLEKSDIPNWNSGMTVAQQPLITSDPHHSLKAAIAQ
jgi:hypothetical protein